MFKIQSKFFFFKNYLADHVLLRLSDFADDPPIFITVRTRTKEGAVSSDSNVCRVPRGITNTTELTNRTTTLGIQSNPLNLGQAIPGTGARSSLVCYNLNSLLFNHNFNL